MSKLLQYIVFQIVILLYSHLSAQANEMAGTFVGIDEADGMAVWINPDPSSTKRFKGRVLAKNKTVYNFTADRVGETLQGQATAGGRSAYLHISYKSVGIVLNWIPILSPAREGVPAKTGETISYVLIREGTYIPQLPGYFAPPPAPDRRSMNTLVFLDSYQFWPPAAVNHGYALIPSNHRALLRFYPTVQTDILWKLCKAGSLSPQRQSTMRGQGVSCPDIIDAVDAMQQYGSFNRYKKDVAVEKEEFRISVGCGQGMLRSETCKKIAKKAAERALDLRNVRSVINSYLQ